MSDWRTWDHGDPAVDEHWRKMLRLPPPPPFQISRRDALYVPEEFQDHGLIDPALTICRDILAAS